MPIYEYVCAHCETEFEEFVDVGTEEYECPECGKTAEKILSRSNWNIKGVCYRPTAPIEIEANKDAEMAEQGYTKSAAGTYIKEPTNTNHKVLYTLFCDKCDYEIEEMISPHEKPTTKCPHCEDVTLEKKANFGSFKLCYNPKTDICDWEGNTSQYWNDVKKARQEGRDVKGAHEE